MAIVRTYCGCMDLRVGMIRYASVMMVLSAFGLATINLIMNLHIVESSMVVPVLAYTFVMIVYGCLLAGAIQKSKCCILIYTIIKLFGLNILTTGSIYLMVTTTGNIYGEIRNEYMLLVIPVLALEWYFWICAFSYYEILSANFEEDVSPLIYSVV